MDAAFAATIAMNSKHEFERLVVCFLKDNFKHLNNELHWRLVVVQK